MTHTIHLTPLEHAYLLRLLGGASDQGIKTLGEGLTAVGVLALRDKMERAISCCTGGPQWGHAWDCPSLP